MESMLAYRSYQSSLNSDTDVLFLMAWALFNYILRFGWALIEGKRNKW